ncbi:MAG: transporter related protein [Actinomycetospora sp.]|nr:transporter related protein [Actinomycetospora sp.]
MRRFRRSSPRRPLDAVELAEAAALGDLVAVVCVLTRLFPVGPIGTVIAAFPAAVLALRRPGRAGPIGVLVAVVVAFLVGGVGPAGGAASAASLGCLVGVGARRGWATLRTALTGVVVLAVPTSLAATAVLAVLAAYRELVLDQLRTSWGGLSRVLRSAGVPDAVVAAGDRAVLLVTEYWWVSIPALAVVGTLVGVAVTALVLRRPLRTVQRLLPTDLAGRLPVGRTGQAVAPLPLHLRGVTLPSGPPVDLDLDAGRFVAVTGPNGAGKSTLARVVAGRAPAGGTVERPGDAGLGLVGGTAMVFQRPDSQVLGVRVADDLRWGLPPGHPVPVDELLARVGLDRTGDRDTATLSGGELQRLAVAALLARRPAVMISDESTAMLDPEGRTEVTDLLRSLAHADGVAVLHITHHDPGETDTTLALPGAEGGREVRHAPWGPPRPAAGGTLRLRGVDVVHDAGTPWRRPVLSGVDLDIPPGRTILVTGPNGAGKTSLAWLLAGLAAPARGTATLDGAPLRNGRDGALLAVQHARPALLRPTVGEEVEDAAGIGPRTADATLAALGLDPAIYRDRPVDELSGGEQRRVLLAGLLGAGPRVLVLDEPLAGLDTEAAAAVRDALRAARAAGTTLVVVTHDTAPLDDLGDAVLHVDEGTVHGPPEIVGASAAETGERERRPRGAVGAVRTLPGPSPLHRVWAGTKIAALVATAAALAIDPAWPTLAAAVAVLLVGAVAARLPRGAVPRPPKWLLLWAPAIVFSTLSTRPPLVEVFGYELSIGGLERVVLFLATTLVSLLGAALLIATTPLGAFPPLLERLVRVGRRLRVPPATPATAIVLGLRLVPLLLAEGRTSWLLLGQRRPVGRAVTPFREQVRLGVRTAMLACAMATRRAAETGEAITARGGPGAVAGPDQRPGRADLVVVLVVTAILAAGVVI